MKRFLLAAIDVLLCLGICLAYAGTPAPEVNESHYLIKARHFWDPAFAQNDLFVASADAHWFFFSTMGWLTHSFSLPTSAWLGRLLVWLSLAIGWRHLARGVIPSSFIGVLTFPAFLGAVELGQVSGEWVVGGFEAKGMAYALLLAAIGEALRDRWRWSWILLGLASAFHVVVGGWVTLTCLLAFTICKGGMAIFNRTWRSQWPWLIAGGCISLAGLLPALWLNRGIPADVASMAAHIYVYDRLPHHLSPLHFSIDRWTHHIVWLILVGTAYGLFQGSMLPSTRSAFSKINLLWVLGIAAFSIAFLGLIIDLYGLYHPKTPASLLRFYWFRWNDVAFPIVIVMLLAHWCLAPIESGWRQNLAWVLLLIPSSLWLADRTLIQWNQVIPEADCRSLLMPNENEGQELKTYQDWMAVCGWIQANTPEDALFITPRYQQSFVWYSQRAEVVNWKNVPQDATSMLEWRERMRSVYPYATTGGLIPNNVKSLRSLATRYGAQYAVLDRRVYYQLPRLPIVYPRGSQRNQTYVVVELPSR